MNDPNMITIRERDWGMIVTGIIVAVVAIVIMVAPGLSLAAIAVIAGIMFLLTGVSDIIDYVRYHNQMRASAWEIVFAVVSIVIGLVLVIHPVATSSVLPWLVGVVLLVFGVIEIASAVNARQRGSLMWGLPMFAGFACAILGILFFVLPDLFTILLGLIVLVRGISLILYGWNIGKELIV